MAVEALYGNEGYAESFPRTQVYQATHNENDERLKYMHRSFISFSFGGRWIEDFNLIAVTNGDRIQRSGSGAFEDLVTNYEVVDGQFYWGTHYLNNQLQLSLATDGITQNQLDDFLHWFAGGCTRELILAEHPNRAIMARIAEPPVLSLLPFEKTIEVELSDIKYTTSTTEYKGEIGLNFIMDEPFWYAKNILLATSSNQDLADKWIAANGNDKIGVYSDSDAIKVIIEDGIPTLDMIQVPIFMGKDVVLNYDYSITAEREVMQEPQQTPKKQNRVDPIKNNGIAVAAASYEQDTIENALGIVGARIEEPSANNEERRPVNTLYYPGTAPVAPIVKFSFCISFNSDGYISVPCNSYVDSGHPYSTLTFESINKYELKFSLPGAFMAYNKIINIIKECGTKTGEEILNLIKTNVKHGAIRKLAISVFNNNDNPIRNKTYFDDNNEGYDNNNNDHKKKSELISSIKAAVWNPTSLLDGYSTITIDCKTGKATGTLNYSGATAEDVGDMIKSNYLLLRDRNYPNKRGEIVERGNERVTQDELKMTDTQYEEYTKGYAYDISFSDDCKNNVNNLIVTYDYLYY